MVIPVHPPRAWFEKPAEGIPTDKRITITADGRVFGYIALWDTCHMGMGQCTRPPKGSPSNYEYAHQGETLTAEGDLIATAVIGGGAGHAPMDADTALVPKYYESIDHQLMRVRYGEDENGLWFAGALWPNVEELEVAQIRASSISGDWRWHAAWRKGGAGYDFAGACLVNIPGFPMHKPGHVNSESGSPYALAASATYTTIIGDEEDTSMCDGSCGTCTCGKSEEKNVDQEALNTFLTIAAERFGLEPVTASGTETETEKSEVEELREQVASLTEAVNGLVADKLLSEIEND